MIALLNEIPLYSLSLGPFMPVILLHALSSVVSIPIQFSLSITDIMCLGVKLLWIALWF